MFLHAIAGLVLGMAAFHPGDARAATIVVSNCDDSGAGSLRDAVALAADGDTVVLQSPEGCNPITLTSGQIEVPQNNLAMIATPALWIDANRTGRVFHHTGSGTLRIDRITLINGLHVANFATGGCVHCDGNVELHSLWVSNCEARGEGGTNPMSLGGGVHANNVLIRHSTLSANRATGGAGHGGGLSTLGRATIFYSNVQGNEASAGGGVSTLGGATITYSNIANNVARNSGGMEASGSVTINKSAFHSNRADLRCGALCVAGTGRTSIIDSTLMGNNAAFLSAGSLSDDATISNSTIGYNVDTSTNECVGAIRARHLKMQSTLAANNFCAVSPSATTPPYDIAGRPWEGYTLTGANNLIGRSRVAVPADTISGDPGLDYQPALNGGPTYTLQLLPGSPAIDRGNNVFNRLYDQRGPGFPRVEGARADIGAVEF
ncbi:MAG: hypothetical protein H7Y19_04910 [Luteimonas sp.]|nr:hypothetical protein [Luteimonas sp.]